MILPGSYANGFAPRDGRPLYPELWRGCVGAWAPCLGPSGLTLRDWSEFGNHGTLTNITAASGWAASSGRHALAYPGTATADVQLPSTLYPIKNGDWSFATWFNATSLAGFPGLFFNDTTGLVYNSAWYIIVGDATTKGGPASSTGVWTHIAVTKTASRQQCVINGIDVTTNRSDSGWGTTGVRALGRGYSSGRWSGLMDDVFMWNREISINECRLLASRRGIAYDLAARRRSVSTGPSFNRRRRLLVGASS